MHGWHLARGIIIGLLIAGLIIRVAPYLPVLLIGPLLLILLGLLLTRCERRTRRPRPWENR